MPSAGGFTGAGVEVHVTSWPESTIWWQVYPLGFTGANLTAQPGEPVAVHRLTRLIDWLDYVIELGCSGLQLGPIFASESHGYDTIDHLRIDPRLGDDNDFDSLISECRARGLHVLLDGVFNHVGRGFGRFQEALEQGPESDAARWFRIRWPSSSEGEPEYDCFEGHGNLVALNQDEPEVARYITKVMAHWLDRGASGWRLDAAYAVAPQFWRKVIPPVRERQPESWFAGEVIHGDYVGYVAESGLDSITQYELWKALWSSLNDSNFFELAHALERHNQFSEHFLPLTFIGNHDVTRIASQLTEPRHLGVALAVLMTVAGSPSIYYGDEQGMQGVKEERFGGDDAVRGAFPGYPHDLEESGWPIFHLHQELIALRRRHSFLSGSRIEVEHLTNEQLAFRSRRRLHPGQGDSDCVTVLLNIADHDSKFPVTDIGSIEAASDPRPPHDAPYTLAPHSWAIYA